MKRKTAIIIILAVLLVAGLSIGIAAMAGGLKTPARSSAPEQLSVAAGETQPVSGSDAQEDNGSVSSADASPVAGTASDKITASEYSLSGETAGSGKSSVKQSVADVKLTVNGVETVFVYKSSKTYTLPGKYNLDGGSVNVTADTYADAAGNRAVFYEGADEPYAYHAAEAETGAPLADGNAAATAAKAAAAGILTGADGLNTISAEKSSGGYTVILSKDSLRVSVSLSESGALVSLSAERDCAGSLPEAKRAAAEAKMKAFIDGENSAKQTAEYKLVSVRYEKRGEAVFALFETEYYPVKGQEAKSVYEYYCIV